MSEMTLRALAQLACLSTVGIFVLTMSLLHLTAAANDSAECLGAQCRPAAARAYPSTAGPPGLSRMPPQMAALATTIPVGLSSDKR